MQKPTNNTGGGHPEICAVCGQLRTPNQARSLFDQLPQRGYIRQKLLIQIVPISKSKLWRDCQNGSFPKPYKISDRVTGWRVEEVRKWLVDKGLAQ
jgi:prophage regulatory protein